METVTFRKNSIIFYSYVLLFTVVLFYGLYHARSFLIPVSLAVLFSMLLWPVSRFLERKGLSRAAAAGVCIFILLVVLVGFLLFFSSQVASLASDMSNLPSQLSSMLDKVKDFLQTKLGINVDSIFPEQRPGGKSGSGSASGTEALSGQGSSGGQNSGSGNTSGTESGGTGQSQQANQKSGSNSSGSSLMGSLSSYISAIFSGIRTIAMFTFKTITGIIILLVYVFLMLLYRHVFLNFIQKISQKREEAQAITKQVARVSEQYLVGRLIVIAIIAVINSVGLTLIGIQQGVFFGVLAAVLNLVPYIGILIGAGLPLIVAIVMKQAWWPVFAVLGLFVFVQLLENYYLTPKIVGSKVKLNPLFTIMTVLVGGYLWGVGGMILFIPFLAMLKIIFDHVESLHPYGYLIGDPSHRTRKK